MTSLVCRVPPSCSVLQVTKSWAEPANEGYMYMLRILISYLLMSGSNRVWRYPPPGTLSLTTVSPATTSPIWHKSWKEQIRGCRLVLLVAVARFICTQWLTDRQTRLITLPLAHAHGVATGKLCHSLLHWNKACTQCSHTLGRVTCSYGNGLQNAVSV